MPPTNRLPQLEEDAFDKRCGQVIIKFRKGDVQGALQEAERVWDDLPEPKTDWAFVSGLIAKETASGLIDSGQLADAKVWLGRMIEAYGDTGGETVPMMQGKFAYASNNLAGAHKIFDQVFKRSGKRPFQSVDKKYWKFYREYHGDSQARLAIPLANQHGRSPAGGQLSNDVYTKVVENWELSMRLADQGVYIDTIPLLIDTLNLLPDPKSQWEAATQLYAGLGDSCYQEGILEDAELSMRQALLCPNGKENPLVWAVLGQSLFDQGRFGEASEALLSAYMLDGKDVFEDEDPKYLKLLEDRGLIS